MLRKYEFYDATCFQMNELIDLEKINKKKKKKDLPFYL